MSIPSGLPRNLAHRGDTLLYSGLGRSPGCHVYMNLRRNAQFEVYVARVATTGRHYVQVAVDRNQALQRVRVDGRHLANGRARAGDRLLIGGLAYAANGPVAEHVWPLASDPAPTPPRVAEKVGTITDIGSTGHFAFLASDDGGREVFVPGASLAPGLVFRRGLRVRYRPDVNDRGPIARNVRLA